ncbi:hypothetical protein, partial [Bacteroides stercoris]|uniref:hypothetical protein n=1 Tax=Bacteroides stercoris TaxID=46506 RepID=UPI0019618CB9
GKILSNFLLLRYLKKIFYNSVAELRKNSCFTCNRLVFIRPARKKEPVRFILPLLCAIFAPDTNVMN